ncbi:B12-binding domain-containing radical SAM protein [Candidatus Woesearchaeota archaeon]|nr:B12-binding domain-containing radical SAM protein [Candidatus Woesearchaeota archaeon]
MSDATLISMQVSERNLKHVPTNTLQVLSIFEDENINIEFKDYNLEKGNLYDVDKICNFLKKCEDYLFLTSVISVLPNLLLALKKLKETNQEKKVILGGHMAPELAKYIIKHFSFVDVITLGFADKRICEVYRRLKKGESLKGINGIVFSENNKTIITEGKVNASNVSKPAFDKINMQDYDIAYINDSIGCPYNCTFCNIPIMPGRKLYYTPIKQLRKEITTLYDKGIKNIMLSGEAFTINKKRVIEVCDLFSKEGRDIKWRCYGRVNHMNEEMLQKMSKAGCYRIFYGIESASNKILRRIKKGFTINEAFKKISISNKYIEEVVASMMWGFPFETMKDFNKTVLFIMKLKNIKVTPALLHLAPQRNTSLYNEYKKRIRFSKDLISNVTFNYEILKRKELATLIQSHPEAFLEFHHYHSNNLRKKANMINYLD